ncbi:hypothetical protein PYW08_002921 [Mythimna loreyi]|uniref:Uncharacterized protein n=1 Tax=Mythimna loreyi TaxID=667449 RepID=A0ACC2QPE2_9NEOP|nr:hypothetical protein PYW08_002921 [Mythimna loreyi]
MQKCVDIRNKDSCDFFKSFFVVNNGCDADESEQNLYSTLFNFTTPKMKCPIQAGRYRLRDYPFHTEDNYVSVFESKISTSVFGFTFRLDGYSRDHKMIFCVETYLQLLYKRNHKWFKSTNERVTTSLPTTQQTTVENEDF